MCVEHCFYNVRIWSFRVCPIIHLVYAVKSSVRDFENADHYILGTGFEICILVLKRVALCFFDRKIFFEKCLRDSRRSN